MADQASYDISLGRILNNIPDPISKRIVGVYKHNASYTQNLVKINSSSFTYLELEQCAVALKVKQHDPNHPGEKLFGNKKIVADRIILKIESHFPDVCDECNDTYCNDFGHDPTPLSCYLCLQGSHNCEAIQQKLEGYPTFAANKPTGLIWLCRGCRLKNNPSDTKAKKSVKFQASTAPPAVVEIANDEDEEDEEDRPSPRRNADENEEQIRQNMCALYKKNQCPHGASGKVKVNGETCPNPHPRKCLKFCRYGNKHGRGCQKGRSCPLYHPILCKFSVRYGECKKKECTFTHLRHTKRQPSQREFEETSQHERRPFNQNYRSLSQYDQEFPPLRPRQRRDSNVSATSSVSESFRTPFPRSKSRSFTVAPPQRPATIDNSGVDFLVRLIEDMKASFGKEISELKVRLPPLEKQYNLPEPFLQTKVPQLPQSLNLPPAPVYQWNPQYNQNSMY